jgi:hypothetical protein
MAQIQRHQGDYVEEAAVEAFIENTDIPMENGTSIINLVIIIYTLNFDNALYYFNKALNLKRIKSTKPVF